MPPRPFRPALPCLGDRECRCSASSRSPEPGAGRARRQRAATLSRVLRSWEQRSWERRVKARKGAFAISKTGGIWGNYKEWIIILETLHGSASVLR